MRQDLGETTNEMMKADDHDVQKILNSRPSGHYWIVISHKNINKRLDSGEMVLVRHIKAYDTKPRNLVGTIILEVKDGSIVNHTISPHDAPIDWNKVERVAGLITNPTVFDKHPIGKSYIYTT